MKRQSYTRAATTNLVRAIRRELIRELRKHSARIATRITMKHLRAFIRARRR